MAIAHFQFVGIAAAATAMLAAPASAQAPVGPDAGSCRAGAGGSAILVNVKGFRKAQGFIRVQLHGTDASTWLKKPGYLKRIELPVTASVMPVCVRVPGPGRYGIAVRHDEDGDKKMTRHDGGGYSRNPRLSITKLSPKWDEASFAVGAGVTPIDVRMNYLYGLSIRPAG